MDNTRKDENKAIDEELASHAVAWQSEDVQRDELSVRGVTAVD
jgi:hypothetical protein